MKITLITPVYNGEGSIERTIKSILSQNYDPLEYIIIDGGSTDGTLDIISRYRSSVSIVISEKDKGIADAYNKGIKLASGELIGIIASDDELTRDALKILARLYDGHSDVISGSIIRKNQERYKIVRSDENLERLRTYTSLAHPATFIRKDAYDKYGLYSLQYRCAIDRELLLRFFVKGASFQIIDHPFTIFNVGGISTYDPIKNAYPEDKKISIAYGKNILCAEMFFWRSVIRFYIYKALKCIAANTPVVDRLYKKYNHSKAFLSKAEMKDYMIDQGG